MEKLSSLQSADRVEIFKHLACDDSGDINMEVFDSIACDNLHAFLDFCDKVFAEKDKIEEISCSPDSESGIRFNITYKSE